MGFWHTGYMEFHEPVGLEGVRIERAPERYACVECDETFESIEDLRKHRFESHPLRRPTLLLRGKEIGAHTVRITTLLEPGDVITEGCEWATLNGQRVSTKRLRTLLARTSSDMCRITLGTSDISSEFTLDFRIASTEDLSGVEHEFSRIASGKRLDSRAIEDFISATAPFRSAIGYCDGVCSYLYGVLAKERAPDSSLDYETYVGRYNKAADELAGYDRPLARAIGSLIAFHFNHFTRAVELGGEARIGDAAARYQEWLYGRPHQRRVQPNSHAVLSRIETLVTDWDTEQIARWTTSRLSDLAHLASDVESFLARNMAEYDRVKLRVLLAEMYSDQGDSKRAIQHAKAMRNMPAFESWAESKIRHLEDHDEHH